MPTASSLAFPDKVLAERSFNKNVSDQRCYGFVYDVQRFLR